MESEQQDAQEAVNQIYAYAAQLMVEQEKTAAETNTILIKEGLDEKSARTIVRNLEDQIADAKKSRANKDMLYGALWCIGGTVGTLSGIGFIFWGAILFGGIQFFKGLINSMGS